MAQVELVAQGARRVTASDGHADSLDAALAQLPYGPHEEISALALPVPAEVHQQRLVGRKPEAQPRDLALLRLQQPEPVDVHGVVHELDPRPRRTALRHHLGQLGADAQDALDPAAEHRVLEPVAGPDRQAVVVRRVDVPEDLGGTVPVGRHRGRDVEAREMRVQDRGLVALAEQRAHEAGDVSARVRGRDAEGDPVVAQLVQPDAILRDRTEHGLTCPAAVPGGAHHSAQHRDERTGIGPSVACQVNQTHLAQANPRGPLVRVKSGQHPSKPSADPARRPKTRRCSVISRFSRSPSCCPSRLRLAPATCGSAPTPASPAAGRRSGQTSRAHRTAA